MSSRFVVIQWNGLDYADSTERPVAVYDSLAEAVAWCNTHTAHCTWADQPMSNKDAYTITEFSGGEQLNWYSWDEAVGKTR
jgi:hypothetical protein